MAKNPGPGLNDSPWKPGSECHLPDLRWGEGTAWLFSGAGGQGLIDRVPDEGSRVQGPEGEQTKQPPRPVVLLQSHGSEG